MVPVMSPRITQPVYVKGLSNTGDIKQTLYKCFDLHKRCIGVQYAELRYETIHV